MGSLAQNALAAAIGEVATQASSRAPALHSNNSTLRRSPRNHQVSPVPQLTSTPASATSFFGGQGAVRFQSRHQSLAQLTTSLASIGRGGSLHQLRRPVSIPTNQSEFRVPSTASSPAFVPTPPRNTAVSFEALERLALQHNMNRSNQSRGAPTTGDAPSAQGSGSDTTTQQQSLSSNNKQNNNDKTTSTSRGKKDDSSSEDERNSKGDQEDEDEAESSEESSDRDDDEVLQQNTRKRQAILQQAQGTTREKSSKPKGGTCRDKRVTTKQAAAAPKAKAKPKPTKPKKKVKE